eukprot:6462685-Amphidinium_carterae.1
MVASLHNPRLQVLQCLQGPLSLPAVEEEHGLLICLITFVRADPRRGGAYMGAPCIASLSLCPRVPGVDRGSLFPCQDRHAQSFSTSSFFSIQVLSWLHVHTGGPRCCNMVRACMCCFPLHNMHLVLDTAAGPASVPHHHRAVRVLMSPTLRSLTACVRLVHSLRNFLACHACVSMQLSMSIHCICESASRSPAFSSMGAHVAVFAQACAPLATSHPAGPADIALCTGTSLPADTDVTPMDLDSSPPGA